MGNYGMMKNISKATERTEMFAANVNPFLREISLSLVLLELSYYVIVTKRSK